MKNAMILLMIAAAIWVFPAPVYSASQSNFVISPPPIPWYEFQQGQTDLKVGGNYVNLSSTNNEENISIDGGGFNLTARHAFSDPFALDFMFNYMYIGGNIGGGDEIDIHFLSWNPNIEIQHLKMIRSTL